MPPVQRSLERITTGYSVFEKDQVLTEEQLNSVADYADDQIRLTRVRLLGVGLVCGLQPSLSGSQVRVTRGLGVTTDGDLLHLDDDVVYDRFKPYDKSYPAYPPLYMERDVHGEMIAAYELVPVGVADARATPLSGFAAQAGTQLASTTAVLLMESYIKDDDLCSGTDCDNLGAKAENTPKLLLVVTEAAGALRESVATPGGAFGELPEIATDRPSVPATTNSPAALAAVYRSACKAIHEKLVAALPRIPTACSAFMGDVVGPDSAKAWVGKLDLHRKAFADSTAGIQYYYDFLNDVVDTYNEFRERLFDDNTLCVPALDGFPKHLLLGDLGAGAGSARDRTGFYPSPLTGPAAGELEGAKFLLRRLDALLARFEVNTAPGLPIRITPSHLDDRPLGERAIPFYYSPEGEPPIHIRWSYRLARRGMEAYNYSYHAASYDARGGAADPLRFQIGRFGFFRIEGHVGKPVADALSSVEEQIRALNLPFSARSVHLGSDPKRVVKKPGFHVTDLHRLHQILRTDVVHRLEEAEQFNVKFKGQVDAAVAAGDVAGPVKENDQISVQEFADQKSAAVATKASSARDKLAKPYLEYRANPTAWQADVTDTLGAAGEFKYYLGSVVRTNFTTPFDALIASPHLDWLPWLDDILGQKEEEEIGGLLFSRFAAEHPQLEHFAGVPRGGTFVLAYDDNGTVVADFMLPYHCCEKAVEEPEAPEEPPLKPPVVRPPFVINRGVDVIRSRDKFFETEWVKRTPEIDAKLNQQSQTFIDKLDYQNRYIDQVKDSVTHSIDILGKAGIGNIKPSTQFEDAYLGALVKEGKAKAETLEILKEQANDPALPAEGKQLYKDRIATAEKELGRSIEQTADYVSKAGVDVSAGSEGFTALMQLSSGMAKISSADAIAEVKTGLSGVANATANVGLKTMLGGMLGH